MTYAEGGNRGSQPPPVPVVPPPGPVVKDAERAFRERNSCRGKVVLMYDSFLDDADSHRAPRLLMFAAGNLDLLLTVTSTPKGSVVSGSLLGAPVVAVGIRRPFRATIAIHAGDDGMLVETLVPSGAASVLIHAPTGQTWQSDWLTL